MKPNWIKFVCSTAIVLLMTIIPNQMVQAEDFKQTYTSDGITTDVTYSIQDDNTVSIKDCTNVADKAVGIRIPETVTNDDITYQVTALDDYAFNNEDMLVLIEIPGTVKTIGAHCFDDCDNLQKVIFVEDGLEKIGEYAFFSSGLTSFTFPSTVKEVGRVAFGYAKFPTITIPKSVTTWGDGMFYASSTLTTATFEEGCTVIPDSMFQGCDELTTVNMASTITTIEHSAFSHGGTIKELVLPASLQSIAGYAFYCTTINKLVVNCDNVKLDGYAMYSSTIDELHCSKQSTFYQEYADSSRTKIVLTGIYMVDENVELGFGKTYQLTINNPVGTTVWTSSDTNIATVSNTGLVTGVGTGSAVITAVNNGVTMQCKVTVGKFKLNQTKATLGVGATVNLKVTDGVTVQWKSSNKKVATVNSKGVVTAKKKGSAKITATAAGKTLTCKITVKANERKNLEKYPKKASAYQKDIAGFGFSKIKRDSNGNYIITGHFLNNYSQSGTYLKNLTITVYKNGKKIAKQKYSKFKVKAPAHSMKPVTIKIKKSKISKKTTDLRTGKITIKVSGGILYR